VHRPRHKAGGKEVYLEYRRPDTWPTRGRTDFLVARRQVSARAGRDAQLEARVGAHELTQQRRTREIFHDPQPHRTFQSGFGEVVAGLLDRLRQSAYLAQHRFGVLVQGRRERGQVY
jgi:hypothetical protein